jgi:hypothetical protein
MRYPPYPSRRRQRGDINLPRLFTVIAIFVAILAVPLYFLKGRAKAIDKAVAAERAQVAPPPTAKVAEPEPEPASGNHLDRFGLSFGWMPDPGSDQLHASCHGEPRGVGQPHRDSCNPYQGDTSCRTLLPLLCARAPEGDTPYALSTSLPVAGFLLSSLEDANARCAQDLGSGWRVASFHDNGGWELRGPRLPGTIADRRTRAWVFISDQPGNCWNKP